MHPEVLAREQEVLLPLLRQFSRDFGLVGGTAIALHIGHRRSLDFDLFTTTPFDASQVRRQITATHTIDHVLRDWKDEYTLVIGGVKCTFLHFPFPITFSASFDALPLPDLLTLAAMKAYTLGRRAKWKDYVDLFFVLRDFHPIRAITQHARVMFGVEFNEKVFRAALAYFDDVDSSESIDYLDGFAVADALIREQLTARCLE